MKLLKILLFVISLFLFLHMTNASVLGKSLGPGFYFDEDDSGSINDNTITNFNLVTTGFIRRLHPSTLYGSPNMPFDNGTRPLFLEVFIKENELNQFNHSLSDFSILYARINGSADSSYQNKYFKVVYVNSIGQVDFQGNLLYITFLDMGYNLFETPEDFMNARFEGGVDVSNRYSLYEYLYPSQIFNITNFYNGYYFVYELINSGGCKYILSQSDLFSSGFVGTYYELNLGPMRCNTNSNLIVLSGLNPDEVSYKSWNNEDYSKLRLYNFEG